MEGGLVGMVSISGAPCSPDLTPLDALFLWGYIKTKVYKTKVNDITNLKERFEQEIIAIKRGDIGKCF